ncbi:hypothetical protein H4R34_000165 [Dimargaris verticillata]|uniref:Uncharacterized protein n=1 Tax=Dimargaris verticillata TaxID=2761393 RepID=A0A9W8BD58_9FUNG|nr:hypothetical protein H4R34_000165 [Dimargaris verticillata]
MPKKIALNSAAVFDLRAQIEAAKRPPQHTVQDPNKLSEVSTGAKRTSTSVWQRQNRGVAGRAQRDLHHLRAEAPSEAKVRKALERKARLYDRMVRREGVDSNQHFNDDGMLVNFDQKYVDAMTARASSSDSSGSSDEEDTLVEFIDEFGRSRTLPKSQVPREFLSPDDRSTPSSGSSPRSPASPTQRHALDAVAFVKGTGKTADYYDPHRDARNLGVGHIHLSHNEQERQAQLAELTALRQDTKQRRVAYQTLVDQRHRLLTDRMQLIQRTYRCSPNVLQLATAHVTATVPEKRLIASPPLPIAGNLSLDQPSPDCSGLSFQVDEYLTNIRQELESPP